MNSIHRHQDELDAVNPDLWVEYDEAEVHTFNGTTTADEDYTYRFTSNVTGTVSISDNHGNQYYTDKEIKKADTVEFKLSDFQVKLPDGDTTFTAVVTPYENAVNADGSRKYDDRLLLKDYSPVTVTDTVTKMQQNSVEIPFMFQLAETAKQQEQKKIRRIFIQQYLMQKQDRPSCYRTVHTMYHRLFRFLIAFREIKMLSLQ